MWQMCWWLLWSCNYWKVSKIYVYKWSYLTIVLSLRACKSKYLFTKERTSFGHLRHFHKNTKQLLDEVFVISRIIKVEVALISRSQRLRLITLTETLIILDITKTECVDCFIIHWTKKWKSSFWFFTDGKQHKARKLDMITRDLECPWHDNYIICSYDVMGADFENSLYAFGQSEKS